MQAIETHLTSAGQQTSAPVPAHYDVDEWCGRGDVEAKRDKQELRELLRCAKYLAIPMLVFAFWTALDLGSSQFGYFPAAGLSGALGLSFMAAGKLTPKGVAAGFLAGIGALKVMIVGGNWLDGIGFLRFTPRSREFDLFLLLILLFIGALPGIGLYLVLDDGLAALKLKRRSKARSHTISWTYALDCVMPLEDLAAKLNKFGPWRWKLRNDDTYGPHLVSHPIDGLCVRVHGDGARYGTVIRLEPYSTTDQTTVDARFSDLLRQAGIFGERESSQAIRPCTQSPGPAGKSAGSPAASETNPNWRC